MNVWDRSEWQISKWDSGLICQQHGMIMLILVKLGVRTTNAVAIGFGKKKCYRK